VPAELWAALAPHERADERLRSGATTLHTHLHFLASYGGQERVEALLARGATPDLQDAQDDMALHVVLRKASQVCRRKYAPQLGRFVRTVFDAGADDELWFDDDECERLLSRTTAAARLWHALVAAGWSPHARNAAGETPLDLLRRACEHAAMLTERSPSRDLKERLAALNLWDALLAETVPGTERHPAALAADAAVARRKEEAYRNFLAEL
jgi:ankyrin repeat protein